MDQIREAILSGDRTEQTYAGIEVPQTYRAATVHKDEAQMFAGLASRDKDPRKSLHVEQVHCERALLAAAQEVFLCNAVIGVWPVRQLGAKRWPLGPVTRRVQAHVAQLLAS